MVQESTGFSPNDLVFGHTVQGPLAQPPQNLIDYVHGFRYKLYRAQEVARDNLTSAQGKMKKLYDRQVEKRVFLPGDQVFALLPIVSSPFQAKFSGPYSVVKKVSDQNYVIATPNLRSSTQLCHINLLKPYYSREQQTVDQEAQVSGAHPACLAVPVSPHAVAGQEGEDVSGPDEAVLYGRLKNSETLQNLDGLFSHLDVPKRQQLVELMQRYPCLFGDTPSHKFGGT